MVWCSRASRSGLLRCVSFLRIARGTQILPKAWRAPLPGEGEEIPAHRAEVQGGEDGEADFLPPGGNLLEDAVRQGGARRKDLLPVERADREWQRQDLQGIACLRTLPQAS